MVVTLKGQILTVLNAQQDPQCPWFLTGVTYPSFLQSTESGTFKFDGARNVGDFSLEPVELFLILKPFNNSFTSRDV